MERTSRAVENPSLESGIRCAKMIVTLGAAPFSSRLIGRINSKTRENTGEPGVVPTYREHLSRRV